MRLLPDGRVLDINKDLAMNSAPKKTVVADEFASFMRAYQDMVFSVATRLLGNDRQAEDISQEVFVKAYEQFGMLRESESAGGWLKTVTTNLCLNHLSRYRKRWRLFSEVSRKDESDDDEFDVDVATDEPGSDSVFDELNAEEQQRMLEAALMELPDHQRVPLVLYHFEGISYEAIATQMNISLSKLKTDLLRGRAALTKAMQFHVDQLV
jgi:RNA polymerase sigma-70 factor (ECF subfamily)